VWGGSVPALSLPTSAVSIRHRRISADALAAALRAGDPPVFARIRKDRLLVDPRTLLEGDAEEIAAALERVRRPAAEARD
jgi:L-seryl-tRNA(Ser) seleniumtransferase